MIYHRQIIYSLEALGYLASQPDNRFVNVKELARELKIPRHFLGKVLTDLVKKKLVSSIKGPSGGFRLAVNPENISIYQILTALGDQARFEHSCLMGLTKCTPHSPCPLHDLWLEFIEKAVTKTRKLTLENFSQTFRINCDQSNVKLLGHEDKNTVNTKVVEHYD